MGDFDHAVRRRRDDGVASRDDGVASCDDGVASRDDGVASRDDGVASRRRADQQRPERRGDYDDADGAARRRHGAAVLVLVLVVLRAVASLEVERVRHVTCRGRQPHFVPRNSKSDLRFLCSSVYSDHVLTT